MATIYADQTPRTTAAYVCGVRTRCVPDNSTEIEQSMKADFIDKSHYFAERVVFGSGRVAMIFKVR